MGRGAWGIPFVLIGGQIALSVILLVGAGLFLRTLGNARAVDTTARPDQLLLANVALDSARYQVVERRDSLYAELLDRLHQTSGVTGAAVVMIVPLGGRFGGTQIQLPADDGPARSMNVGFNVVSPGHFSTVGVPLTAGRVFNDGDRRNASAVAIVNEELARLVSGGRSPLGQRFVVNWRPARSVEVVGVVRDGRFRSYRAPVVPTVYVPFTQAAPVDLTLEVRSAAPTRDLTRLVTTQVASLDTDLAVTQVPYGAGPPRPRTCARAVQRVADVGAGVGRAGALCARCVRRLLVRHRSAKPGDSPFVSPSAPHRTRSSARRSAAYCG